jgi:sigma-B regulation protein RsbU (phosphoserine phosphatase)
VIINIYQDRIVYSKAGHPEQYLIRKKTKELKRLAGRGRMLGLTDESEYHSQEEPIENGDLLILFTDGVFEQLNEERKKFGENRLAAMVQEMIEDGTIFEKKISEINQVILTPVEKHYQNVGLTDDLTLITIRILR